MSSEQSQDSSKDRLLAATADYCHGVLTVEEGAWLDGVLAADPQARRWFADAMWLHASLYAEVESLSAGLSLASPTPAAATRVDATAEASLLSQAAALTARPLDGGRDGRGLTGHRHGRRSWWAAAAGLALAAAVGWLAASAGFVGDRDDVAGGATGRAATVARITATRNCLWRRPELGIGYGSALAAGQKLELEDGLVEITFEDGAALLLEGPATFVVDAPDRARLDAGRVVAVASDLARSFRIQTPTVEVSNAQAEYGVVALESGAAEIHVFTGDVQAQVLDKQGRRLVPFRLASLQAARISSLSTSVIEFPADDAQFVRHIAPAFGPGDGLLAYEGFRYPEGPLDGQNGDFGWAGPWFNLSADEAAGPGSNQVATGSLAAQGISAAGNHALISAQRNRIRRALGTSVGGVFDAEGLVENKDEVRLVGRDGKRVYFSFLQRVSKATDGFYGVELHRGDGNGNRVLCVGHGADGAGYGATSNVNIYGASNLPALGQEDCEVNLFVVKITFGLENRDRVEIFRNPESLRDEQACQVDAVLHGNFAFDRISLANFDGSKTHEVDEIRVGTHFLAVTGRWGNNLGRLSRAMASAAAEGMPAGAPADSAPAAGPGAFAPAEFAPQRAGWLQWSEIRSRLVGARGLARGERPRDEARPVPRGAG